LSSWISLRKKTLPPRRLRIVNWAATTMKRLPRALVERIGDEIDRRVDARLGRSGDLPAQRHRSGELSRPVRASLETVSLALGSMIVGGIVSWNVLNDNRGGFGLFVFIWVVITVINIAYARRR
jgi:hypothetical protein